MAAISPFLVSAGTTTDTSASGSISTDITGSASTTIGISGNVNFKDRSLASTMSVHSSDANTISAPSDGTLSKGHANDAVTDGLNDAGQCTESRVVAKGASKDGATVTGQAVVRTIVAKKSAKAMTRVPTY